jgi:cyclophilin family peptidyl-prolyl cis-trans isomerase
MPDPKRERQRQNRDAARAAQLEAAKQARKKQSTIRAGVGVVLILGLAALGALVLGGDDDKTSVASEGSSTTTASSGPTTTTTVNPAVAAVQCNDTKPPDNPNRPTFTEPPPMTIDTAKKYTAVIETSCGKITIDLDAKAAPKTVNSFVFLADKKFYDGLTWHRVVKDFVIQGGDPEGTGSGGPGYQYEDELPTDGYKVGSLAMANSGPNTNGSQFFVVTGAEGAALPNKYSRFGLVTGGLEVAQKLESFADPAQKPTRPLYILSIKVTAG